MTTQADELREAASKAIARRNYPSGSARDIADMAEGFVPDAQAVFSATALYLRANARSLFQHDDTPEAWVEKVIGLIEEAGRG